MKFFAIFAAVCAVASASQGWTLTQLSQAVASPVTDAALKPVLEQALNHVMENIFTQENYGPVAITTAAGVSGHYNLAELEALLTPQTNPIFLPYIEDAFEKLISAIFAGENVQTIAVQIPALDITYMSLEELDQALASPATNPSLVPYLEYSLNQMVAALFAGQNVEAVAVAVPSGLGEIGGAAPAPAPAPVVIPAPVVPVPVVPAPVVPVPVVPAPAPETSTSSPLVQIILNVRKSEDLDVVGPTPGPIAVRPDPIQIVEQPIIKPDPIQIVEQPIVKPHPIQIVEQPIVKPDPILIVEQPIVKPDPILIVEQPIVKPDPIQIVEAPSNPIDAILLPIEALPPTPGQVVAPMM